MIKKFTDEDYNIKKSNDLLKFECENCGCEFEKQKRFLKSYLKLKESGKKVTLGSIRFCSKNCENIKKTRDSTIETKCKNCETTILVKNHTLRKSKSGNSFCSKSCSAKYNNRNKKFGIRRSKLEKFIESKLIENYDFEILFNDKNLIGSELDIYIPSLKLAFEINGIFHYEPIFGQDKLNSTIINDGQKFIKCFENEISLYVIDTSGSKRFEESRDKKYIDIIFEKINEKLKLI